MRIVHARPIDADGRVLIIVAIVLLFVLPDPWDVVVFVIGVGLGIGELFAWNRTVRGHKKVVGPQTLVGQKAVVISPLEPTGRVRIEAETWEARSEAGAAVGDVVEVVGLHGLQLQVTPVGEVSPAGGHAAE
jgi:membrane protein implicated in regulation of membrane protease activity